MAGIWRGSLSRQASDSRQATAASRRGNPGGASSAISRQHCRLLAQREEKLRAPQHVGVGDDEPPMREYLHKAPRRDLGQPRRFGIARIARQPFCNQLSGDDAGSRTTGARERRQPFKSVQRGSPGRAWRTAIEDRTILYINNFADEPEARPQKSIRFFQLPGERIEGLVQNAVRHPAAEKLAIDPASAPGPSPRPKRALQRGAE